MPLQQALHVSLTHSSLTTSRDLSSLLPYMGAFSMKWLMVTKLLSPNTLVLQPGRGSRTDQSAVIVMAYDSMGSVPVSTDQHLVRACLPAAFLHKFACIVC